MVNQPSRRDVGKLAAGLAAWLSVKSEATAQTAPAAAPAPKTTTPTQWQIFQKNSEITGVYSGNGGTYVVMSPKEADGAYQAWVKAAKGDRNLSHYDDMPDNTFALFFMKDGKEPLIAQNVIGINSVFDTEHGKPDVFVHPEAAKRHEDHFVANILTKRNVLADDGQGIIETYNPTIQDIPDATLGHMFSMKQGTALKDDSAFLTCPNGDEVKLKPDAQKLAELNAKLAKAELQLAQLAPANLEYVRSIFIDPATQNRYVLTELDDKSRRLYVLDKSNKQLDVHALEARSPRTGKLTGGRNVGYNYFYKTPQGQHFNLYEDNDSSSEHLLVKINGKERQLFKALQYGSDEFTAIERVRLMFDGKPALIANSRYMPNNAAVISIPNACPAVPVRGRKLQIPKGWQFNPPSRGP